MGLFGMCHFLHSNNLIFGFIFPKGITSFSQAFGQAGKIQVGSCMILDRNIHLEKASILIGDKFRHRRTIQFQFENYKF
jgi:hypothetical protein